MVVGVFPEVVRPTPLRRSGRARVGRMPPGAVGPFASEADAVDVGYGLEPVDGGGAVQVVEVAGQFWAVPWSGSAGIDGARRLQTLHRSRFGLHGTPAQLAPGSVIEPAARRGTVAAGTDSHRTYFYDVGHPAALKLAQRWACSVALSTPSAGASVYLTESPSAVFLDVDSTMGSGSRQAPSQAVRALAATVTPAQLSSELAGLGVVEMPEVLQGSDSAARRIVQLLDSHADRAFDDADGAVRHAEVCACCDGSPRAVVELDGSWWVVDLDALESIRTAQPAFVVVGRVHEVVTATRFGFVGCNVDDLAPSETIGHDCLRSRGLVDVPCVRFDVSSDDAMSAASDVAHFTAMSSDRGLPTIYLVESDTDDRPVVGDGAPAGARLMGSGRILAKLWTGPDRSMLD